MKITSVYILPLRILSIIMILFPAFSNGQWMQTNGPFEARVYAVFEKNQTILAGIENGIWYSNDSAQTWERSSFYMWSDRVNEFDSIGSELFTATSSGIFRSADNGISWTQMNNGLADTVETSLLAWRNL